MIDNLSNLNVHANGNVFDGQEYIGCVVRKGNRWSAYIADEDAGDTFLANYPSKVIASAAVYNEACAAALDEAPELA